MDPIDVVVLKYNIYYYNGINSTLIESKAQSNLKLEAAGSTAAVK